MLSGYCLSSAVQVLHAMADWPATIAVILQSTEPLPCAGQSCTALVGCLCLATPTLFTPGRSSSATEQLLCSTPCTVYPDCLTSKFRIARVLRRSIWSPSPSTAPSEPTHAAAGACEANCSSLIHSPWKP